MIKPTEARFFSTVDFLGELVAVVSVNRFRQVGELVVALLLIGFVALLPFAFESSSPLGLMLFTGGFGLAVLIGALYWIWKLWQRQNIRAALFQNGWAYFDGAKMYAYPWDHVSDISAMMIQNYTYGFIPAASQESYTILCTDGVKLKLDHTLYRVFDFINVILRYSFPARYEKAKQQFDDGRWLEFGVIKLQSHQGMEFKGQTYSWEEIYEIEARGGITVYHAPKVGRRVFSIGSENLPNIDVLLALTQPKLKEKKIQPKPEDVKPKDPWYFWPVFGIVFLALSVPAYFLAKGWEAGGSSQLNVISALLAMLYEIGGVWGVVCCPVSIGLVMFALGAKDIAQRFSQDKN